MATRQLVALALMTAIAGAVQAQLPQAGAPPVCSLDRLASLPWCELEQLYRHSAPGAIPDGFARGRVVYPPCEPRGHAKARSAALFWRGKHFSPCDSTLINQWLGVRAIRARVYPGPSWLDGQPALILDYSETSHVWADVRDEMREVAPGLYVGAMYLRRCPEPQLKLFFILEACPAKTCH